ncbi:MAG: hypothetical protein ACXIVE_10700 [Salinarimonas sp.]
MKMFGYCMINRELTEYEIRGIATYFARNIPSDSLISDDEMIYPAREQDIELMTLPNQRVAKITHKKYVDAFFEKGILQIGSYDYFRSAGNPEIRDHQEGLVTLIGQGNQTTVCGKFEGMMDNYVFCTYLGRPDPVVVESFGYDSFYFINDPEGFADAVRNSLNSKYFSFGKCVYCEEKALIGRIRQGHSFQRVDHRTIEMIGEAMHFVKPVKFSHQNEFRFTWRSHYNVRGARIIECPDAIQFCSRA